MEAKKLKTILIAVCCFVASFANQATGSDHITIRDVIEFESKNISAYQQMLMGWDNLERQSKENISSSLSSQYGNGNISILNSDIRPDPDERRRVLKVFCDISQGISYQSDWDGLYQWEKNTFLDAVGERIDFEGRHGSIANGPNEPQPETWHEYIHGSVFGRSGERVRGAQGIGGVLAVGLYVVTAPRYPNTNNADGCCIG